MITISRITKHAVPTFHATLGGGGGVGYKSLLIAHRRRCPYLIHTVVLKILPLGMRKFFKNRVLAIGRGGAVFGAESAFTEKVMEY
jgi:hypothetical protein